MSKFTIDNNRSTNSHTRTNFLVNNRNISVYRTDKDPSTNNFPNNMILSYTRNLVVQNPKTTISPDFTFNTKTIVSYTKPREVFFGIDNTIQSVSSPPNFIRYEFGTGDL